MTHKLQQFFFYRTSFMLIHFLLWVYFNFLLLQTSDDLYEAVPLIMLNNGLYAVGLLVGFIGASFSLQKLGYREAFRLGYVLLAIATIVGYFNIGQIENIFYIVAVIRGIGSGFYWASTNTFTLKELHGTRRHQIINTIFTVQYVLEIVVPITAGVIIEQFDYNAVFLLAIATYLFSALWPFEQNTIPENHFNWDEISSLSNRKGFKWFGLVTFLGETFNDLRRTLLGIIPFVLIGTESGTGLFLSGIALVAAIIAYAQRNDDDTRQMKFGLVGAGLASIATVFFAIVWTIPALVIRSIVAKLGFAMWDPVKMNLENEVEEMFLRDFLNESAIEVLMYREMMLTVARVFNMIFFVMLFFVLNVHIESALRFLVIISAIREFIPLLGNGWMKRYLRIGPSSAQFLH